ncbi:MAG: hypothetical protein V2I67_03120 [Thermoanaerobaculales bacterium]|jgi:hypothetical protein|nr:hypothetical protein [Thermoanaerobaculales bacterium]
MTISYRILVLSALIFAASALSPAPEAAASGPSADESALKGFPGASPLVIPAAAFSSKGNDPTSTNFIWNGGYLRGVDPSGGGCVQAPAYLPDNVEITGFYASFIDNDPVANYWIWLTRTTNTTPEPFFDIAIITTSGVDPDVQTLAAPDIYQPMVTLPENAYYVSTCLPSASTALISARIYYVASDLIFADGFEAGGTSSWSEVTP